MWILTGSSQGDSLHAPVRHLTDEQLVLVAAIDRVGQAELFRQLAGRAELAHDLSIELDLVDGGVFHAVGIARVRDVEILRRPCRHAHRERRADVAELRLEVPVGVEHLDAFVADVSHVDVALRVDSQALHPGELAVPRPGRSPLLDEVAALVELGDAVRVADAVRDVDVAGPIPRDIGRAVERGAWNTRSGRAGRPAATTTATGSPSTAAAF